MNNERQKRGAKGYPHFQVVCTPGKDNGSTIRASRLSVTLGQRVRLNGTEQMWDSVGVYAEGQPDGTLVVRVVVFNPDWDGPLQIACIRSRPEDALCLAALGCNLDHVVP
jgi:hypothetical protein